MGTNDLKMGTILNSGPVTYGETNADDHVSPIDKL